MPWDNIGSRWVIPGQNLIDLNLEERQYSRQIYHFLNIDKENKLGGKHTVFFKLLLSLLGGPTWSQSLAEIHRIFISLKTNISSGKKKHCLAQGLSAKCLHIRRWLRVGSPHTRTCMQRTSLHSQSAPPHSKQHFQVTSLGLPQTTGAPLGFLFPSLQTLFLKKKKNPAYFLIECHSARKTGLQYLNLPVPNTWGLVLFCFVF